MKTKRIVISLLVSVTVVFTFVFGGTLKKDRNVAAKGYRGIITLWHIDTFEGGTGSRKQFLLDVGAKFEKLNEGVLVMAVGYTVEGAEEEMKKGNFPDMISFGNGLDINGYTPIEIEEEFIEGVYLGETAAVIWARGGYALFSKKEITEKTLNSVTVSESQFNLPLVAFALSGFSAKSVTVKSPLDAYVDFVSGKAEYLVGTQRDVIRLKNRGYSAVVTPLPSFSDLNQFIAITGRDEEKNECSKRFVSFLLSDDTQSKLNEIGLFSYNKNVSYEDENLSALNGVKGKGISVLAGKEKICEIRETALCAASGNEEALKKLNNVAFLP